MSIESGNVKWDRDVDVWDASGEAANVVIDKVVRVRDRLSIEDGNGSKNCK